TEAREHFARPRIQRIAVQFLEAVLHIAIPRDDGVHVMGLVRIDHRRFEPGHFGGEHAYRPDAVHHRHHRALARHFADVLAEIADGHAGIDRELAIVGAILPGDHTEQRRLAGAIGADKSHLFSLLDAHRSLDEQDLVAVLLADVIEANHEVRAFSRSTKHRRCLHLDHYRIYISSAVYPKEEWRASRQMGKQSRRPPSCRCGRSA